MSTQLPPFHIVIPARFASQRFPGKLLATLAGKPVIQWVYELAMKSGAQSVVIATDHPSLFDQVSQFGAQVVMTSDQHENGTERLAEVAMLKGWRDDEIVVNVQGDEPLLPIEIIHQTVLSLAGDVQADMATAASRIESTEDFFNPNVVKVVCDQAQRALYFSRAPIPWDRDGFANQKQIQPTFPASRHIGLYVYRTRLLKRYSGMPVSPMEKWEKLEQLRLLHHGVRIQVAMVSSVPPHGVDTPDDLNALEHLIANTGESK